MFPPRLPPITTSSLKSLSASSLLQVTHPPVQVATGSSTMAKSESLPQLPFQGISGAPAPAPVSRHPSPSSSLSLIPQPQSHGNTTSAFTKGKWTLPSDDDNKEEVSSHRHQRKRPAPEPDWLLEDAMGAYDKPYIGQHQQGIPYTHPLKRIKMENS